MDFKRFFPLLITFYIIVYIIIPHTEYQPADPGIKILQIRDFIDSGFSSFAANYKAKIYDETLKYFPTKPPFAYLINHQAYYVFPYFLTLFLFPFYAIGGIFLLEFLSLISGILVILICILIVKELQLAENFKKQMIIFLSFGSINSIYSFMLGEAIHASLLLTLSVYLVIKKDKQNKNWQYYLFAGLLSGIAVMLRIELALFCLLLLSGTILLQNYNKKKDILFLIVGLALPAIVLISSNYFVTQNILGLRGIEFLNYSGAAYPMKYRLMNEIKALFGSNIGLGLFAAWPVFLFLIPFFIYRKDYKIGKELKLILFISIPFTLFIPLLVKNIDGSILGPRFAATVQPLLILATFKAIEHLNMKQKVTYIISKLKYLILYSIVITLFGYVILYSFNKTTKELNLELDKNITSEMVILRNKDLYNAVFPSYTKRYVLEIDKIVEIEDFVREKESILPETISIVSSKPKNNIDNKHVSMNGYALTTTFTTKGILILNFKKNK